MSAEDQKTAEALALYEYTKAKGRHALLRNDARKIATSLDGWAKSLWDRPEAITFDGKDVEFKNYMRLGALVGQFR